MRKRLSLTTLFFIVQAVLVAGILLVLLSDGKDGIFTKHIRQGIIYYKSVAVGPKQYSPMEVPEGMKVTFKDDYSAAELEAGYGMAKMKFVSDPVNHVFLSQVFFADKMRSVMTMDEVIKKNRYFPDYTVTYGDKVKMIAGYRCSNAILHFKDETLTPLEVWYTNDISIKNPNWSNAYYKIDGVLMDYQLKKFGLELHFTADHVEETDVDSSIFTIPSSYRLVRDTELDKLLSPFYE